MAYVGNIGEKIDLVVKLDRSLKFPSPFSYDGTITLYLFLDENENVIVWKTSTVLTCLVDGRDFYPRNGDTLRVRARVKEHSLHKETEQTIITRPKFELVEQGETYEERVERITAAQMDSLEEGDGIWTMPYRQYKEHYSDCETLYGSFNRETRKISVIIRAGRLVPSGTRFMHFAGYKCIGDKGSIVTYRAVCEDNAIRRAEKEFPGESFVVDKIYYYNAI